MVATKHLKLQPLDVEKFIKVNELQEVNNPMFFTRSNMPTSTGLLSNEIFGITKEDRTSIFAYIELAGETFMHPLAYKVWCRLDNNVKLCAYETETFTLDKNTGKLKPDPKGETGIKYLKKIIKDIDFEKSNSDKRNIRTSFIEKYRDKLFIENFVVIPAGYRDVDTQESSIGVGEINKMYNEILRDCRALKESDDYGLTLNGSLRGRIQDSLVHVYDFFAFGRDPITGKDAQASGLSRKLGLIRRAGMSKSFDWGARMVICTQNLRKENIEDLDVDLDTIGIPIASIAANFYPFMLYWIRNWFSNNFTDEEEMAAYDAINKKKMILHVKDWREYYSDERIKEELDRFMHGNSNRFIAIEAPIEEDLKLPKGAIKTLMFKGFMVDDKEKVDEYVKQGIETIPEEGLSFPIQERPLTWCDLIYMAAHEVVKDKYTLITRYPIDTYWNQFPAKISIISSIETEPMIVNNTFYKNYPKIRLSDINKNTSNKFIDVALPNNVRLDSIGGDFDGDTISSRAMFSIEANHELSEIMNSKKHYISLGAENAMFTTKECIQSLYNLTLVLPEDKSKLTKPEF